MCRLGRHAEFDDHEPEVDRGMLRVIDHRQKDVIPF